MDKVQQDFEKWAKSHGYNCESWDMLMYDRRDTEIAWEGYQASHNAQQAEIDRLMLEFCPNEMSKEQVEDWAKPQRRETEAEYQNRHVDDDHIYENL